MGFLVYVVMFFVTLWFISKYASSSSDTAESIIVASTIWPLCLPIAIVYFIYDNDILKKYSGFNKLINLVNKWRNK